jgi:hypothetical protein
VSEKERERERERERDHAHVRVCVRVHVCMYLSKLHDAEADVVSCVNHK